MGQGCWHLGQGRHPAAVEEEALRTGISLGMTLIDTSGNYGGGRSEEFLKHVIAGQRDRIFLVTKVEANEVSGDGIARACAASLARLGSGYIDLYLLHWPVPSAEFSAVVASFEKLRATGKIRAWGVSNFDTAQMEGLMRVPDGHRCATLAKIAAIHDCLTLRDRPRLGDTQRKRDRNPRVGLADACEGERSGALDRTDAPGPSGPGARVPATARRYLTKIFCRGSAKRLATVAEGCLRDIAATNRNPGARAGTGATLIGRPLHGL